MAHFLHMSPIRCIIHMWFRFIVVPSFDSFSGCFARLTVFPDAHSICPRLCQSLHVFLLVLHHAPRRRECLSPEAAVRTTAPAAAATTHAVADADAVQQSSSECPDAGRSFLRRQRRTDPDGPSRRGRGGGGGCRIRA